ncbi:MAG: TlpA disulfide reductase family protein [Phycisphaerales bacterium]
MLRRVTTLGLLSMVGLAAPAMAQMELDDQIVREGLGERRVDLTRLELTQFDPAWWELLSDWRIGEEAPTPDTLDGQVVLVVTFAGWYPPSVRPLAMAQRLYETYGEDGLVVIGVHDPEGFDDGVEAAERRGVTFPIAIDAEGAFREALLVDQDPDFYLIDRSGQLRFADIETSSVELAVEHLVEETREEAETLVSRIDDARRRAEIEARRTARINQQADLLSIPDVAFPEPSEAAYALAHWPRVQVDPNATPAFGEPAGPRRLQMPADGFYPSAPASKGRAFVVYFWDRNMPATTARIRPMDEIQRRYARDISVVGVMMNMNQQNNFGQPVENVGGPEARAVLRETHRSAGLAHTLLADLGGALMNAAEGNQFSSSGQGPRTMAAVVSSDGVIRWFGDSTSHGFESAVALVAREDPGVRARRAAEDEYLRRRGR